MSDNPESQKDYGEIQEAGERRFPRPTRPAPGSIEQRAKAVANRAEYFRGQIRVSTPLRTLQMPSGREVTLPRTPPDWTSMRRAQENFLTGQPEYAEGWEDLTPSEQQWWQQAGAVAGGRGAELAQETINWISDLPVVGKPLSGITKGVIGFFDGLAREAYRWGGYSLQAKFEPELRTAENLSFLLKARVGNQYDSPEAYAALSEERKKVIAAWRVAEAMLPTLGLAEGGPGADFFRIMYAGMPSLWKIAKRDEGRGNIADLQAMGEGLINYLRGQWQHMTNGHWEPVKKGEGILEWHPPRWVSDVEVPEPTERERAWMEYYGLDEIFSKERYEENTTRIRDFIEGEYLQGTGGLPEMLKMREQIINGADFDTAYAAYQERIGPAMAFRGSLFEAMTLIFFDPSNRLLEMVRPIERLHATRQLMLTNYVSPEISKAVKQVRAITSQVDEIDDFQRLADDLGELAKHASIEGVEGAIKNVQDLAAAEVDDVVRYREALAPLDEIFANFDELQEMPRYGRVIVALTGGDPLNPNYGTLRVLGRDIPVGRVWRSRLNPITLSAEARANEYIDTVYNNADLILRMTRGVRGAEGVIAMLKRGMAGAFGKTFGHMFVSPMGRQVQAVFKASEQGFDDLLRTLDTVQPYIDRSNQIARILGEPIETVVTTIQRSADDAQGVFRRLTQALNSADELSESQRILRDLIRTRQFTTETLIEIGGMLKSTPTEIVPYTDELFRAAVIKTLVETAAEMSQGQFGVKEYRFIEKASNYVKAAESLVLLGLNPIYPIQNFFNNEVTMIARGVYGLILPRGITSRLPGVSRYVQTVEGYFESFGQNPARLYEGFGISGPGFLDETFLATTAEQKALIAGREAIRTTRWGKQGRITGAILEKMRQIKGTRQIAAGMERWARERSIMVGHMKTWNRLWRPGRGFSRLDDFRPNLAARLGEYDEELPAIIQDLAASARRPEDFDALKALEDLRLNPETIFRRTAEELGLQIEELPEIASFDVREAVRNILTDLPARPTTDEIHRAFNEIRDIVQVNLDEAFEAHIPSLLEEAVARVEANGANGVLNLYGDIADTLYQRHADHMARLDQRIAEINLIENPVLKDRAWKALLSESDIAWTRYWDMEGAVREAIVRGMDQRGVELPAEFMRSFNRLRDNSQDFIALRNRLWGDYFDQIVKGRLPEETDRILASTAIHEQLDQEYMRLIELTEASHHQMDQVFLGSAINVPDEYVEAATEWRRIVRAMRRADMEAVLEFRRGIRGIRDKRMVHEAWRQFHIERMNRMGQLTQMEKYGRLMLDGDEDALRFFIQNARARAQRADTEAPVLLRRVTERAGQIADDANVRTPVEDAIYQHPSVNATAEDNARLAQALSDPENAAEVQMAQERTKRFLDQTIEGDEVTLYRAQRGRPGVGTVETREAPEGVYDMRPPAQRTMDVEGVAREWVPEEPYHFTRDELANRMNQLEAQHIEAPEGSPEKVDLYNALQMAREDVGNHAEKIEEALEAGRFVPPEAVADYPRLKAKYDATRRFTSIQDIASQNAEPLSATGRYGVVKRMITGSPAGNGYYPQMIRGDQWWTDGRVLFRGSPKSSWPLGGMYQGHEDEIARIFAIEDAAERQSAWNVFQTENSLPAVESLINDELASGRLQEFTPVGTIRGLMADEFDPKTARVLLASDDGQVVTVIDGRYFGEAMKNFDNVTFKATGPTRPLVVYSDGEVVGLIMPMTHDGGDLRRVIEAVGVPVYPPLAEQPAGFVPGVAAPELEPINQAVGQWLAENLPEGVMTEQMQAPIGRFTSEEISAEEMLDEIEQLIPEEFREAFQREFTGRRVTAFEGRPELPSWARLLQGDGEYGMWTFDRNVASQGQGDLFEVAIPKENVLGTHQTYPSLFLMSDEQPALLGGNGLRGSRLVSVNGERPSAEALQAFERMPPTPESLFEGIDFGVEVPSLPNFDAVVGRQLYAGIGADELWFSRGSAILDEMENQTVRMLDQPALRLQRLPEDLQSDVVSYLDHVTGQMNDTKLASIRIAEGMSDAALLNYNRKYNFDNWMNIMMPFGFWWTHSALRWAVHSLDRPTMLSTFMKSRQFFNNVTSPQRGFPSRLRNHVKLDIPFAPEEFGEMWVNPMRMFGLPFEQFVQPFEWAAQSQMNMDRRVERILSQMVQSGEISGMEKQQALNNPNSPLYQRARNQALSEDQNLRFDLLDFMNLSVSPHLPVQMAWNIARGTPENLGPLPHTRMLRNVGTLLGVDPGVYDNVWGNVRQAMGLEAYDEFDVYRSEREVTNMAGENLITADDGIKAMMSHDGEIWDQARQRSAKTEAFRWGARLLGIPVNPYPEGERHQRELYSQFYKALDLKDRGDVTAVRDFFEAHPEFEARLALFDSPEDRMKQFLSDQIWDTYNGLDQLNKNEVRDQLGPQFEEMFLNPETRSLDAVSPEVLAMWSRMIGGEDPGNLAANALPIPLTDPVIAQRMEAFYDYRRRNFPQYYDLQTEYFKLERGPARRAYLVENPQLELYWDWRRDFMYRNPDLAPYIEDDPEKLPNYESLEILRQISAQQPGYTWGEWTRLVLDHGGTSMMNLVLDYVSYGEPLPTTTRRQLDALGDSLGVGGWQDVLSRMEASVEMEEVVPSGLTEPHFAP